MTFDDEHVYQAPLATVEKMYFDTAFCPRKYKELGLSNIQVLSSDGGEDFHVECHFEMEPSIKLPGFLSKLLPGGERLNVQQRDSWHTPSRKGRLDIEIGGLEKVNIFCEMSLEEHPEGAVNRMHWTVDCSVPLVGGKIASVLAKDIQSKSAADLAASRKILQDYV